MYYKIICTDICKCNVCSTERRFCFQPFGAINAGEEPGRRGPDHVTARHITNDKSIHPRLGILTELQFRRITSFLLYSN